MSSNNNTNNSKTRPDSLSSRSTAASRPAATNSKPKEMAFNRKNYMVTIAAVVLVIIGFMLMNGGTEDPFSARKITLAPIVVLLGFGLGIYAIFFNKKDNSNQA